METRSPTAAGDFNGAIPSQSNGYGTGSLPRSGYNNGQSVAQNTSGLSELDSLLQDLQNARYHNGERKGKRNNRKATLIDEIKYICICLF